MGIDAEVDIRDNPLFADPRSDDYAPVRPYWQNIAVREPLSLPEITAQLVYINEVMSSNGGVIRDRYGDSPDWIELYNPHERDVDLSGFYLSDSDNQVDKWRIPDGTVIKAGNLPADFCIKQRYCHQWRTAHEFQHQRSRGTDYSLGCGAEVGGLPAGGRDSSEHQLWQSAGWRNGYEVHDDPDTGSRKYRAGFISVNEQQ